MLNNTILKVSDFCNQRECDNLINCYRKYDGTGTKFYFIENPAFSKYEVENRKYFCSESITALDQSVRSLIQKYYGIDVICKHGVRYSTYSKSPHVPWHHDQGTPNRFVTAILHLTGTSEYVGGDFQFKDYSAPKLEKGDLIIFPASYLHSVSPVTDGTRKTLIFYYEHY